MKSKDYILLKWGTLKACDLTDSPEALAAAEKYVHLGASMSVMSQQDTPEQKLLLCEMIDKVNGEVWMDWEGINCTNNRQMAKDYVMNYGKE